MTFTYQNYLFQQFYIKKAAKIDDDDKLNLFLTNVWHNQLQIYSYNLLLSKVWPKPLFWFRSDTKTETQIGQFF